MTFLFYEPKNNSIKKAVEISKHKAPIINDTSLKMIKFHLNGKNSFKKSKSKRGMTKIKLINPSDGKKFRGSVSFS